MSKEQIFLDAALSIASGKYEFSCNAVEQTGNCFDKLFYAQTMHIDGKPLYKIPVNDIGTAWGSPLQRDDRVMLLCMMAACCEDMDQEET